MLVLLRGIQGSGKSTLLKDFLPKEAILSSDSFRLMVSNSLHMKSTDEAFNALGVVLNSRLKQGLLTVIDATNLKLKDIREYIDVAKAYGVPCYVFSINISLEEAKLRIKQRAVRGGHDIPENVTEKYFERYFLSKEAIEKAFGDNFFELDWTSSHKFRSILTNLYEYRFIDSIFPDESLWFIGDVHACNEELEQLVLAIHKEDALNQKESVIWCVGDLIDRGPSLEKTLEVFRKYNLNSVPGNHEIHFLDEHFGLKECRSFARKKTHEEFANLPKKTKEWFLEYFNTQVHFKGFKSIATDKRAIISHGGVSKHLVDGVFNINRHMPPLIDVIGSSNNPPENEEIYSDGCPVYQGHGHFSWEHEDPVDIEENYIVNLDKGCVYGRGLLAWNPFTNTFINVSSKKWYNEK